MIGSPFLIYFSRKAKIPQAASKREASVVRSHITMISQIRGESHPVLMALLIIALALGLLVLTLQLGMRGYILPGFLAMVAMVVVPFVVYAQYSAAQRKRFMAVPDAAYLVGVHYADQSRLRIGRAARDGRSDDAGARKTEHRDAGLCVQLAA